MTVFGWIVWALACVVLLSFLLAALSSKDSGLRAHHMRHSLLLIAGVTITAITQISKLHLLWWVPLTFFLNQALSMVLIGKKLQHIESKIALIKDKDWSAIDGEACRVIDFSPLGSVIDINGKLLSEDKTTPYACITLECEKLGQIEGYITHKMDFTHLWAAFKERTVKEDEEVIIFWTKKHYKVHSWVGRKLYSAFMPKLWVMICPKEAYDLITNQNFKPEIAGAARAKATSPIVDWKPEVMD